MAEVENLLSEIGKEETKIKNICPVIGMISSGKSSILNSLFNMDILSQLYFLYIVSCTYM